MLLSSFIIEQLLLTNILMVIVNLIVLSVVYVTFIFLVSKYHKDHYSLTEIVAIIKEFKEGKQV